MEVVVLEQLDVVERAFDQRLEIYLRTVIADLATPEESGGRFTSSLREPLVELRTQARLVGRGEDLLHHVAGRRADLGVAIV